MAELLTVARPYAKAAFEYARDHEALDSWSQALGFLSLAVADSDVRRLLGSPKLENAKSIAAGRYDTRRARRGFTAFFRCFGRPRSFDVTFINRCSV